MKLVDNKYILEENELLRIYVEIYLFFFLGSILGIYFFYFCFFGKKLILSY